jgi:menaquinone-dependent protoporphyrinogen oxidase
MAAAPHVLVAYATASGSTAGIAQRIADVLRAAGCAVVCRSVGEDLVLERFDALVLGSAVHNMAWLSPAVDLLRRAAESGSRPVWCFSVGGLDPRGRLGAAMAAGEARRIERQFPAGLTVRGHRVFGGIVSESGVPLWGRVFYRLIGSRPGDHRNWPAIEAWAAGIATQLPAHGPQAAGADVIRDQGPAGRGQQSLPCPPGRRGR